MSLAPDDIGAAWLWPLLLAGMLAAPLPSAAQGLPPGFVYLEQIAPGIEQDIKYAGSDNFTGRALNGYQAPRCILTKGAALALAGVAAGLKAKGLGLLVLDCYRPKRAVRDIVAWSQNGRPAKTRNYYFARYSKPGLFRAGFIARRSGHSRGSTVDLTLVAINNEPGAKHRPAASAGHPPGGLRCDSAQLNSRKPLNGALDMGTDFDCFSPLSATASRQVSRQARLNRKVLLRAMRGAGFVNFAAEWWHFRLRAEPYKRRYFDFPVR